MTRPAGVCALVFAAGLLCVLGGCGSHVSDPGDSQARQALALAAHGRQIEDRAGAAGRALLTGVATRGDTRLVLQELLTEARLLQEDVIERLPFGTSGRVPALDGARELVRTVGYLHSYASGHAGALPLARVHLDAAARALGGAAGALRGHLTPVQEPALAHLEAPPPRLR